MEEGLNRLKECTASAEFQRLSDEATQAVYEYGVPVIVEKEVNHAASAFL